MGQTIDFSELKASNLLPSPKGVRLNVMRLCQREQVSLPELTRQIQADPVLAGRIIKIANSVSTGRSRQIASVTTESLLLVGVLAVRQIVLGISLIISYQNGACRNFDYARFWSHSIAMACAAQALAGHVRVAPVAEMFTCGLLAGIGRLGLASARPEAYSSLLELHAHDSSTALMVAETTLFGFNHLSLGAAMMNDWGFPRLFSDAVLFHEAPDSAGLAEETRQQRLIRMLQMAARIADLCLATDEARPALLPLVSESAGWLGIDAAQLPALMDQAVDAWQEWGRELQVETRPLDFPRTPEA